ncbi:MAG: hypothetical protein COA43_05590 [Robiginitomaculum sp.]|nr:MAG: hypothetical protein COA43_05590 [Robiginitomaculum sp.]
MLHHLKSFKTISMFFNVALLIYFPVIALAQTTILPPLHTTDAKKGLTFSVSEYSPDSVTGIAVLVCSELDGQTESCNPYQGDQLCSIALPVLCFQDVNALAPAPLKNTKSWSGGIIATTPPIAANTFKTIANANAYCATQFGKNWRVANFHDGGGWGLQAYGNIGTLKKHVWIDIKSQKQGTCWGR